MENVLNKEFTNGCEWFVDNKLPILFSGDNIKCILFSKKLTVPELNITCDNNRI